MRHFWPSDNPRYRIAKKRKTMPVPPEAVRRVTGKLKKKGGIKQVKAEGIRQNLLEPGTLSSPPGTEQEKRPIGSFQQSWYRVSTHFMLFVYYIVELQCKFTIQ